MKYQVLSSIASLAIIAFLPFLAQAQDECINSRTFREFYANRDRSCQNIRVLPERQQAMCAIERVATNCPQTCGVCCIDEPTHEFELLDENEMVSCSWLAGNDARKAAYCDIWRSGRMTRDACPFSCSFCQPGLLGKSPTLPPVVTTTTPTRAPVKGQTPVPTKAPTSLPTSTPTKPPTQQPTMSSSMPTIVCANDYNYSVAGKPTDANCQWVGETNDRRQEECVKPATFNNCPVTCGVCCEDDPDYNIVTNWEQKDKRCGWIGSQTNRIRRYCNEINNGALVKSRCHVACNNCFTDDKVEPPM